MMMFPPLKLESLGYQSRTRKSDPKESRIMQPTLRKHSRAGGRRYSFRLSNKLRNPSSGIDSRIVHALALAGLSVYVASSCSAPFIPLFLRSSFVRLFVVHSNSCLFRKSVLQ